MNSNPATAVQTQAEIQLMTMWINQQLLGIPVTDVREILHEQKITHIPLVFKEIAGALNLRGRIVTVIDMRQRLQLPPRDPNTKCIFVVVEHKNDLYSLVVDSVGDVLTVPTNSIQNVPPNLTSIWQETASGVHRLEKDLLIILESKKLFIFEE